MKDLVRESLTFECTHNTRMKYTKLNGKTPAAALAASGHRLRFPETPVAPRIPLKKPEQGKYHVVRFIRSNGILNIFSEQFTVPPEATYEYVVATIDVTNQNLQIRLDGTLIDLPARCAQAGQIPYQMR